MALHPNWFASVQFTMTRPRQTHGSSHRLRKTRTRPTSPFPSLLSSVTSGRFGSKNISVVRGGDHGHHAKHHPASVSISPACHSPHSSSAAFLLGLINLDDLWYLHRAVVPWPRYIHKGSRNSSAFLSHHDSRHPKGFFPRMYAYACSSTAS